MYVHTGVNLLLISVCTKMYVKIQGYALQNISLPMRTRFGTLMCMETKLYVANRVREIRCRLRMRQQDLADQVGVSRQTIISIERGRLFNPTVHTCLMLSRVLREPVDFLFYLVPHHAAIQQEAFPEPKEGAHDLRAPDDQSALNTDTPLESFAERNEPQAEAAPVRSSGYGADALQAESNAEKPFHTPQYEYAQNENKDISSEEPKLPSEEENEEPIAQTVWDFSRA